MHIRSKCFKHVQAQPQRPCGCCQRFRARFEILAQQPRIKENAGRTQTQTV